MVTVGKALEGQVPNANDFIDAAVVIGGVKGAVKTAGKIRDIYTKTGVKPDDLVADMERDVTVGQDLHAENIETPRVYLSAKAPVQESEYALSPLRTRADGERKHDILKNGNPVAEIRYEQDDTTADITWLGGITGVEREGGVPKVELGPSAVKNITRQFLNEHPEIDTIRYQHSTDRKDIVHSVSAEWLRTRLNRESGNAPPQEPPKSPPPPDSPEAARDKMLSKISVREGTDKEPMTFQKLYTDLGKNGRNTETHLPKARPTSNPIHMNRFQKR
jgi:hypothetical protein